MKISPVATGAPAPQTQDINIAGASVSRKEAAKAAFLGQAKVAESDTPINEQVAAARANIRKIKMRTNVSPDRPIETEVNQAEPGQENSYAQNVTDQEPAPDNGISHDSSDAEPVTEVTKPLSPQFAALARQRRALQLKEREIADRERALASSSPKESVDVLGRLKSNPLAVLQEAGVTYDQLTEAILANPSNPDLQAIRDELKATKEEFSKTLTERDAQTEREALAEMRRNTNRLVAEGDDFEMIRETGSQADVVKLIHQVYKSEGVVLDEAEAATLVEEQLLKEAEKIARIKKLQSRLAPAPSEPANQTQFNQPRQMTTLTNRDNARAVLSRRDRAIAAALGQLRR